MFYLVDRRFDMLPPMLSSDLASLHEHVDRLVVSVIWEYDSTFNQQGKVWFGRSVIRNCAAMTYKQVHDILQHKDPNCQR